MLINENDRFYNKVHLVDTLFRDLASHIESIYYVFGHPSGTNNRSTNSSQSPSYLYKRLSYNKMPDRDKEFLYKMNSNTGATSSLYSSLASRTFRDSNPHYGFTYAQPFDVSKYWQNPTTHRVSLQGLSKNIMTNIVW